VQRRPRQERAGPEDGPGGPEWLAQLLECGLLASSFIPPTVASSIATKSGRAMIEALINRERRGEVLAELAIGRMRSKIPDLSMTLDRERTPDRMVRAPSALGPVSKHRANIRQGGCG
jgi:hypothetical protein